MVRRSSNGGRIMRLLVRIRTANTFRRLQDRWRAARVIPSGRFALNGVLTESAAVPRHTKYPIGESAREDGETFGRAVGKRTAQEMTRVGLSSDQLKAVGSEGVANIITHANSLASAGLDRVTVAAWTEAA